MRCRVLILKKGYHTTPNPSDIPVDGKGRRLLSEADIPELRKGLRGLVANYSNLPDPVQTGEGVIYIVLNDTIGTGDCYNPEYPRGLYRVENGQWVFWSGCHFSKAQHIEFCEDWATDVNDALITLKLYVDDLYQIESSQSSELADIEDHLSIIDNHLYNIDILINDLYNITDTHSSEIAQNDEDISILYSRVHNLESDISSLRVDTDKNTSDISILFDEVQQINETLSSINDELDYLETWNELQDETLNNLIDYKIEDESIESSQNAKIDDLYTKYNNQQLEIMEIGSDIETLSSMTHPETVAELLETTSSHTSLIASILVDIEELSSKNEEQDEELQEINNELDDHSSWNSLQDLQLTELQTKVDDLILTPTVLFISLPGEQYTGTDVAMPLEMAYKFEIYKIIARCKVVPDGGPFRADIRVNGQRILQNSVYIEIPDGQERCELNQDAFSDTIICEGEQITIDVLSAYGCCDVMIELVGKYHRVYCSSSSSSSSL